MECTLVVILLQEPHLPLLLLPRSGCKFHILFEPLLLWHRSSPLNLFFFFILGCLGLLFTQESSQFTSTPCFEFGFDVETVGIVDFGDNLGCFLCSYAKKIYIISGKRQKREVKRKQRTFYEFTTDTLPCEFFRSKFALFFSLFFALSCFFSFCSGLFCGDVSSIPVKKLLVKSFHG